MLRGGFLLWGSLKTWKGHLVWPKKSYRNFLMEPSKTIRALGKVSVILLLLYVFILLKSLYIHRDETKQDSSIC